MFEKNTPRDFFLHAGAFISLYLGAIALITLLFSVIDYAFPDQLSGYYSDPYSGAMRPAIASLVVLTPLVVYLFYLIQSASRTNPERISLGVRKWFTYITLFIAGMTVVIDVIVLLNSFLGGTLPTTFLLKVLTILVVMGAGFGYFLLDIRTYWLGHAQYSRYVGIGIIACVLASIVGGMTLIGSPATQRALRFDAQQISDLSQVQALVLEYRRAAGVMPKDLEEIANNPGGYILPQSPEGRAAYEYTVTGENSFELCAMFAQPSQSEAYTSAIDQAFTTPASWKHEAGRGCFSRIINPAYFKPLEVAPTTEIPLKISPR